MTEIRNVIIVGSGPSGYTAAIYAARAGLNPLVIAGSVTAGGALMNTTEVENFPGFVEGVQGPELMTALQAQAEKFGAEIVFDDVTSVDLVGKIKTVTTGMGVTHATRSVDPRDGFRVSRDRHRRREAAVGQGRELVCHVRRVLLPRPGRRGGRRRRLRDGGGHVPHALRQQGHHRPQARRAARLQGDGRPCQGRPQDRVRLELRGRVSRRHGQAVGRAPAQSHHRRRVSHPCYRDVCGDRSRSKERAHQGRRRSGRGRLRARPERHHRHQRSWRVRLRATLSTAATGRPSRRPARVALRRSTRNAGSRTSTTRSTGSTRRRYCRRVCDEHDNQRDKRELQVRSSRVADARRGGLLGSLVRPVPRRRSDPRGACPTSTLARSRSSRSTPRRIRISRWRTAWSRSPRCTSSRTAPSSRPSLARDRRRRFRANSTRSVGA